MITIRYITSNDIPSAEAFCEIYDFDWRVGIEPDEFLSCIADDIEYYIGAFDGDDLIGVISLGGADGIIAEAGGSDALLSDLYVIPQSRNRSIGSMLISYAIDEARRQNYKGAYGDIMDDNLFDYYKRFGFRLIYPGLIYMDL